ncbi:hypothetical protein AB0A77_34605 [Streptomyces varsoviensis]|uniref:hypothetical protein n=1 Tax=Streptomyces varsoviensis TaxID=67373 RepID=UPI0033FF29A5
MPQSTDIGQKAARGDRQAPPRDDGNRGGAAVAAGADAICSLLAGLFPAPGPALRALTLHLPVGTAALTLPMALLAVMLLNAGLGARVTDLRAVLGRPLRLLLGHRRECPAPPARASAHCSEPVLLARSG